MCKAVKKKAKRILSLFVLIVLVLSLAIGAGSREAKAGTIGYDGLGPVSVIGNRDLQWPVPGYYNLQSCFYDHRNHRALDFYAPLNVKVTAAYGGVVVATFSGGYGDGYGNYVVLRHDNYVLNNGNKITLYTKYNHLNTVSVKNGQTVTKGQEVGKVGATGKVDGPHLDFQTLIGGWAVGNSIDPYANELLELPAQLNVTDDWPCGRDYYNQVLAIYNNKVSLMLSPEIAKTSMKIGETCVVKGKVGSTGCNIISVTAGVYRNAAGTGGAVNGIEVTKNPNSRAFDIISIDPVLYFQNIKEGGTYYFVVKATVDKNLDSKGTRTKTASKQFTVRGNQCGAPTINAPTDIAGGKHIKITSGAEDTIHYTIKRGDTVVDTGTSKASFEKDYKDAGSYKVTAYATRSGYTNSSTSSKDFNIAKVSAPKINQSVTGNSMAVNIVSDTSGAVIYYTTSGNTPSTSSTRYNGTISLNEEKTIKAIAVKNGMANSDVSEMTLKLEEPDTPTGFELTSESIIPEGETVTVKWNSVHLASNYVATLYQNGKKVSDVSTGGTSANFVLQEAGDYTVNVYACNFVGNSTETSQPVSVKAMAPSTVNFKDWDGSIIKSQEVPYGHNAVIPPDPERRGYTFLYWKNADKATAVKEDQDITAEYKINTYTVRFYNRSGNQVGPAQKINYMESANSPEADLNDIPTGYVFAGWKVLQARDDSAGDYKKVDSDMKLQAVYYWGNNELPVVAEITSARQNTKTGNYNVTVKLTNYPEDTSTAILRVSLLTKEGKMVKTTKSEFEVDEDGNTTKTVTLKYSGVATKASAVILGMNGDDQTGAAHSKEVVTDVTVQSNEVWGEWSEWTTEKPEGVSGDALETKTEYRYSDKTKTTSTSASMDGWTQYDKKSSWNAWGNWSGWSTAGQTASDSKQVETRQTYRYYYYLCPVCGRHEPYDGSCDCGRYSLTGSNLREGWFTTPYSASGSARYGYIYGNTQKRYTTSLGDGQKWNFTEAYLNSSAVGTVDTSIAKIIIRNEYRYRTRSQTTTYYYYKWNGWSDWGETVYTATDDRQVESRTLYRTREKVPVYSPLAGSEDAVGNIYHIKGSLASINSDLNGKLATIMVYKGKNTDPNEDQIQYVGQTTIGEGNAYEFDVIPKGDPTPVTGDFTVTLGIQGSTGLVDVDMIRYQRPVYTVAYVDDDGTILSTQQIEEGGNATVPAIPKKAGNYFTGWSENAVNVQSNMSITALYTPVDYVVAYVDGANDTVSYDTHHYGEKLTPPEENPTADGKKFVGWDSIIAGKDTVEGNMVVNAVYDPEKYTVEFVDETDKVINTQTVEHGKAATLPAALDVAGKEFLGWSTENEWWYVTSDMTVKPILAYQNSVDAPSYEAVPAENYVAVYLDTATENASIYYTLDETTPNKDSELYDGSPVILENFEIEEDLDEENKIVTLHRIAYVNAVAVKDEMNDSEVQHIVYTDTVTLPMDVTEATVTFETNGGTALETATRTVGIGEEYGELPVPTYSGYDFIGWFTGAEDGSKIEADDICTADITLYAHWEKNDDVHEHTIVVDPAVEATCQQEGKTEGRHCSECNEVLVEQKAIPKTDHKWNAGEISKAPTCSEEGEITYTCEHCGLTKTEALPKTEHEAEGIPAVEATCTKAGKTAGSYCTVCGEIITAQEDVPALGHTFGEWAEVKAATCKDNGVEERVCEVCGEKETRQTDKTAHVHETRNATEATCQMEGYTGDVFCSVCGELLETGTVIEKADHKWSSPSVVEKGTCSRPEVLSYTCEVCGEKKTGEGSLNPKNHTGKTEIRDQKDATTTEEGYTGDTYCLDCGQKIKTGKSIPVLPAEGDTIIRVQDKKVSPGEEVVVPVMIEKNAGIAGFSFDLNYDATILTLKSVQAGSVLSTGQVSTNGNVINWYTSDNITATGEILKLTFNVADSAEDGETDVTIAPHDGKKNLVDETGSYVAANYQPGTMTIQKGLIGDLNDDSDITIGDVVVLNRCVLGKQALAASLLPLADINDDGDITIGDVVILNRHVLGKENILEAREYLIALGDYLGAGGNATISVDDATVRSGETFDLPVWVEDNSGLAGIALSFSIPEGYTLNSITQGDLLSEGTFSVDGNTCTWYAPTNMESDGEILKLNLTAGANAQSETIVVGVKDSDGNNFTDEHGASMLVDFIPGSVKIDNTTECERNGHKPLEAVLENEVQATCTAEGSYDEVVYCDVCGEEISRNTVSVPMLEHIWNEGEVTREATEDSEGELTFTCTVCGSTRTEVIPRGTHEHQMTKVEAVAATCENAGNIEYYICSVCEKYFSDEEGTSEIAPESVVIEAGGHEYGEWEVTREATEDTEGEIISTCAVCGNTRTAVIPRVSHTHHMTKVEAAAATCENSGNIEYFTCSVCGKIFSDEEGTSELSPESVVVEATGHEYGEWEAAVPGDCIMEGQEVRVCMNDSSHKEYKDPALSEHDLILTDAVAPTCDQPGNIAYYTCQTCGEIFADEAGSKTISVEDTVLRATGHTYSAWTMTSNATCTEDGSMEHVCNECGHTETLVVPARGHSWNNEPTIDRPATCTETGEGSIHCAVCDEIKEGSETEIPVLDHQYSTSVTKATLQKNGKITEKCTVCGSAKPSVVIARPKTFTLSTKTYTYNGKARKPKVTVKDSNGDVISSKNYAVSYSANKNPGIATVTITFKGNYSGKKTLNFTIRPKATTVSSVKAAKKAFTVKWKKQSAQTTGYQIQYSTSSKFKSGNKTVTIGNNKTTSRKITKLKARKTYYVRIRTYKTVNGKKYYSSWSKAKKVKTK